MPPGCHSDRQVRETGANALGLRPPGSDPRVLPCKGGNKHPEGDCGWVLNCSWLASLVGKLFDLIGSLRQHLYRDLAQKVHLRGEKGEC